MGSSPSTSSGSSPSSSAASSQDFGGDTYNTGTVPAAPPGYGASSMPSWFLPAAILGGAGLIALVLLKGK